jgi:hypothetical protein
MPLTQEQISQLNSLTLHPRFGQLLKDAMKTWEIAIPIQFDHGLSVNWKFRDRENPECCLLGAAFANKDAAAAQSGEFSKGLDEIYKIENHPREFTWGFDGRQLFYESEAYDFASDVRKILFGK